MLSLHKNYIVCILVIYQFPKNENIIALLPTVKTSQLLVMADNQPATVLAVIVAFVFLLQL